VREVKAYGKDFSNYLYHEQRLQLLENSALKIFSRPDQSERAFKLELQQAAREKRDAAVEKMRSKYLRAITRLQDRKAREERELQEDESEYDARKLEELVSGAETIAGLLGIFGRRRSRSFSQAATKRRMTSRARADIDESKVEISRLQDEIAELNDTVAAEADQITQEWADTLEEITTYEVKPRRADVMVDMAALAWLPYWEIAYRSADGRTSHERVQAWK